jgi:hypothetical protein
MKVASYKDRGKVKYVVYSLPIPGATAEDLEHPNDENTMSYMVRGMTPPEAYKHRAIVESIEPPMPPTKQRTRLPDSGADKLDVRNLVKEDYQDYNDPTFLEEVKAFKQEQLLMTQRATMFCLMVGVHGFDLTDDEIREELQPKGDSAWKVHNKEPLDELLLRLDQLSAIIMEDFDQGHMMALRQKINELSGLKTEEINFTSSE